MTISEREWGGGGFTIVALDIDDTHSIRSTINPVMDMKRHASTWTTMKVRDTAKTFSVVEPGGGARMGTSAAIAPPR